MRLLREPGGGRWTPEFRAYIDAFRSGKASETELAVLLDAAGAAGDRTRHGDVLAESETELDILIALAPDLDVELSNALAAHLLVGDFV